MHRVTTPIVLFAVTSGLLVGMVAGMAMCAAYAANQPDITVQRIYHTYDYACLHGGCVACELFNVDQEAGR